MDANDFVAAWRREREELLATFLNPASQSATARLFAELNLSPDHQDKLVIALRSALTDTLYTMLMGIDGAANVGGIQEQFLLSTSNGVLVAKPGELEAAAYRCFHAA